MSKEKTTIRLKNFLKRIEKKMFLISLIHRFYMWINIKLLGPKKCIELKFKSRLGYKLNLENPKTFNEKIQWLKMFYFQDYYLQSSDKYLVREYLKKNYNFDCCPPLLFVTQDVKEFSLCKIDSFPCILKISNGSGQNLIINNKDEYSDKRIRKIIKKMIYEADTHARYGCEPQYIKKTPYIVVEKLLQTTEGKLPNDYKLFYFNGKLEFIYCSVDRLGGNYRQMYDANWNRLDFLLLEGANKDKYDKNAASESISQPKRFSMMKEFGSKIAINYPLVRVDFYDVDGLLFIGEITLHHGSGHDMFYPKEYDLLFGQKLSLPAKNYVLKI